MVLFTDANGISLSEKNVSFIAWDKPQSKSDIEIDTKNKTVEATLLSVGKGFFRVS